MCSPKSLSMQKHACLWPCNYFRRRARVLRSFLSHFQLYLKKASSNVVELSIGKKAKLKSSKFSPRQAYKKRVYFPLTWDGVTSFLLASWILQIPHYFILYVCMSAFSWLEFNFNTFHSIHFILALCYEKL